MQGEVLAVGQVVIGPISDRFGRRTPILIGTAAYLVASILCAVAPTISVFLAMRFVQGLAGAAGIVVARASVRDLAAGTGAAVALSVLAGSEGRRSWHLKVVSFPACRSDTTAD